MRKVYQKANHLMFKLQTLVYADIHYSSEQLLSRLWDCIWYFDHNLNIDIDIPLFYVINYS